MKRPVPELLNEAVQHHQAGRLKQAQTLYNAILQEVPDHADSLHLLGVIASQVGQLEAAVTLIRKAIDKSPGQPHYHVNLGLALQKQGKSDEAIHMYREALKLGTGTATTHNNLGNALMEQGSVKEALKHYRRAVQIDPAFAEAHNNIGNVLESLGRWDKARRSFQQALRVNPGYATAHYNLGNLFQRTGRFEDAATAYQAALDITPETVGALHNLGAVLIKLGRKDDALAALRKCVELNPGHDKARHMLAALMGETTETAPREYVQDLFDNYAHKFDQHLQEVLEYKIPEYLRCSVDRLLSGKTGRNRFAKALDLGCGTGLVGDKFRDIVDEFHGVDLSPKMLTKAAEKGVYDTIYEDDVVAFFDKPHGRISAYDLISAADVFIYVGNLVPVFAVVKNHLVNKGLFIFSIEGLDEGTYALRQSGRYAHNTDYVHRLASEHGFKVESCDPIMVRNEKGGPIPGYVIVLTAT